MAGVGDYVGKSIRDSRMSRAEFGEEDRTTTYFEIYEEPVICTQGYKFDKGHISSAFVLGNNPYGVLGSNKLGVFYSSVSRIGEKQLIYIYNDNLNTTTYKDSGNTTAGWEGTGSIVFNVIYPSESQYQPADFGGFGFGYNKMPLESIYEESETFDFTGSFYKCVGSNNSIVLNTYGGILLGSELILMRFENNLDDEVGSYAGSGTSEVYFNHNNYFGSCVYADHIDISPLIDFTGSSEQTIAFWMKKNTGSSNATLCFTGDGNTSPSYHWAVMLQTGSIQYVTLNSNGTYTNFLGSEIPVDDTWYFVACRRKSGSAEILLNNTLIGSVYGTSVTSTFGSSDANYKSVLFARYSRPSNYDVKFTGSLDEFRVYNRWISDDELGSLYNPYYESGSYVQRVNISKFSPYGSAYAGNLRFSSTTPTGTNVTGSYKLFRFGSWETSYTPFNGSEVFIDTYDVGSVEAVFNLVGGGDSPSLDDWYITCREADGGVYKGVAQSINIGSDIKLSTTKFDRVLMTISGSPVSSIVGSISTDGGSHWKSVTFGVMAQLDYTGSEILWRLEATGSDNVVVENIWIEYKQDDV